jgi:branched-chain amino acid transport system ATP-binding protein
VRILAPILGRTMALLEIADVHARYRVAPILQGVSVTVEAGEIVSIFGRNGAGKTTLLKTAMGWLAPSAGAISFEGRPIAGLSSDRIFRRGVGFIPEDRRIFATLSVQENLGLGLFADFRLARAERRRRLDRVFALFPRLAERRRQAGRTLSGGEQQMLAIGRALVGAPKLLLVDEPSEGLAPMVVTEIFDALVRLRAENIALLLVEQNVQRAAAISDRCYVMEKGRIVAQGTPDILKDESVRRRLSV